MEPTITIESQMRQLERNNRKLECENRGLKKILNKLIVFTKAPICEHEIAATMTDEYVQLCNQCNEYLCECYPTICIYTLSGRQKCVRYHAKCVGNNLSCCGTPYVLCDECDELVCIKCEPHTIGSKRKMRCENCSIKWGVKCNKNERK